MSDDRFSGGSPAFDESALTAAYDELPLWSAPFGLKLLEVVALRPGIVALDIGCGTGFPVLELAQRLGPALSSSTHTTRPRACAKCTTSTTRCCTSAGSKMPGRRSSSTSSSSASPWPSPRPCSSAGARLARQSPDVVAASFVARGSPWRELAREPVT